MRLCQRLTWVLVGLYVVRVAIMLPLYWAGRVGALSVAKVALGWPLYVAAIAIMGLILVRGRTPLSTEDLPAGTALRDTHGRLSRLRSTCRRRGTRGPAATR